MILITQSRCEARKGYSPECVEGAFRELRAEGVPRSSSERASRNPGLKDFPEVGMQGAGTGPVTKTLRFNRRIANLLVWSQDRFRMLESNNPDLVAGGDVFVGEVRSKDGTVIALDRSGEGPPAVLGGGGSTGR